MLRFDRIEIGSDAGVRCMRCGTGSPEATFRPAEEIAAELADRSGAHSVPAGPNVIFAGAEPFRHPALPRLIADARAAGVVRIGLRTDGAALARGENAPGSISAGVRLFEFVVLAGDATANDRLSGTPGSHASTLAGLRRTRSAATEAGVEVALRGAVPVCAHNLLDTPATCAMLAGEGCATIRLECAPGLDAAKSLPWLIAAAQTGVVNGAWVVIGGIDAALLGEHALHATDPLEISGPDR